MRGFAAAVLPRIRDGLRSLRPLWLDYVVLTVVFVAGYLAASSVSVRFAPDSRYYYAMALWFGGHSQDDAQQIVAELSEARGYPAVGTDQLFGWGLVQPRVVLPALAALFVRLFGASGLSLTTGIITIVLILVVHRMLLRRYGRLPALAAVVLVMASPLVMYYNTAMLTESLSALWGALALAVAWRYQRDPRRRWLVVLAVVTALSAFTRQATFIVAAAFIVAWLIALVVKRADRRWGWPALVVAVTAVGLQVLQTLVFPSFSQGDQFLRATGTDSLGAAILASPGLLVSIVRTDITRFLDGDVALLVFILLALVSMVAHWRRSESHLLFGAMLGVALYNVTNGTPTSFRYAMPGLIFYLISVALLASGLGPRSRDPQPAVATGTPTVASPRS